MKTFVVGSDLQFPYTDMRVYTAFVDFCKRVKADGVVINGDANDFYSVSTFDKDPARARRLVDELELMQENVFRPLRKAVPRARIWLTEGNHEDRLRRYIWKNAPALEGLPGLTIPKLYNLEEFGIKYAPADVMINLGKLKVFHGHLISQHSAGTAMKHFQRHGTSLLVGHSHRLGAFYKTTHDGVHGAWEGGCLCSMDAEYENFPNWQQGWAVVTVQPSGLFHVELVPIINNDFIVFGGREWRI